MRAGCPRGHVPPGCRWCFDALMHVQGQWELVLPPPGEAAGLPGQRGRGSDAMFNAASSGGKLQAPACLPGWLMLPPRRPTSQALTELVQVLSRWAAGVSTSTTES